MPFCSPDKIIVGDRFRTADINDPAVKEMADSIKECGQLQPILVTNDMMLIAGLHRLLACTILKKDVWWVGEEEGNVHAGGDPGPTRGLGGVYELQEPMGVALQPDHGGDLHSQYP